MRGSEKVKAEFGYFWRFVFIFLSFIGLNLLIQYIMETYFCSCMSQSVSLICSNVLIGLLTIVYFVRTKPVLNQLILFVLSAGLSINSIIFFMYDLPYKKLMAFVSLPFILVFFGMTIYSKFVKDEVK
jgi:hypothetical protein